MACLKWKPDAQRWIQMQVLRIQPVLVQLRVLLIVVYGGGIAAPMLSL